MPSVTPTMTDRRLRSAMCLCLLAGLGCGRTHMGEHAWEPVGGDAGSGGTMPATGGGTGPRLDGGPGGGGGAGGGGAGWPDSGVGGNTWRTDGAVIGGAGLGGQRSGGAGGAAGRGSSGGIVAGSGGSRTGGTVAGGSGGSRTGGVVAGGRGGSRTGGTGAGGSGGSSVKPLWRDSREAFCPMADPGSSFIDLWSDDRGVFVVTADEKSRTAIWSNLGTAWQMTFKRPADEPDMLYQGGLKGFPNGPLILYGGFPCGIQFIDGAVAECSGAASFTEDLTVVSANLAYAVSYDRVLMFDGNFWTQLGGPLPDLGSTRAVWADSSTIMVAAEASQGGNLVFRIDPPSDPVALAGLAPQIDPVALWGFGPSDVWLGSLGGELVHYDGSGWSVLATIPSDGGIGKIKPKTKLWGKSGSLFAIAVNVFGQWDGAGFKVLESLDDGAYFAGLWGNSPSEIFLAVYDPKSTSACGPFRALWFDGTSVGPL